MSDKTIDERVVSMKFDNKEFEKNATQSLSTIQKLKQALNFDGAQKNLNNFKNTINSFQLNGISNSINAIADKFSMMEVAARAAITNITNSFVNAAERWVKAVTIDPIRTGIGVYEQKINSTMTILSNTGKGLRETNEILDELNTYSDKTIFSLNDMTTALGKFTAAGVDAKKAVTIIKGAANEAATMGAGSAEFSRFIYNLTQAYSMGKMTTIDWKSLENAGVAGRKFKEQLIESAKAMKTLTAEGKTAKGEIVTAANLRDFLKDGIITAEVMTDTFKKYADETTEFGKAANDAATQIKTFHQLMDVLAESVASTWSKSFGYIIGNFYEARRLWTNVSTIFEDTIGKMNSNRNKLLAAWYEGFIDPAVEAKMSANELKQAMNSEEFVKNNTLSGRKLLFDSIANAFQSILQVIKPVKEAFREVFPANTARNLWEMTKNLRDFTARLKLSSGAIKEIKDAAKGVFMIMSTARNVIKDIIGAIIPASKNVNSLAVIVLKLAGALGRLITDRLSKLRTNKSYQEFLSNVTKYTGYAIKIISILVSKLLGLIKTAKESGTLERVFNGVYNVVSKVINFIIKGVPVAINLFKLLGVGVAGLFNALGTVAETFEGFFSKIFSKKDTKDATDNVNKVTKSLGAEKSTKQNAGTWTKEDSKALEEESEKSKSLVAIEERNKSIFQNILDAVVGIVSNVFTIIGKLWPVVTGFFTAMGNLATTIINIISKAADIILVVVQTIASIFKELDVIKAMLLGVFGIIGVVMTTTAGTILGFVSSIHNIAEAFERTSKGFRDITKTVKRLNNPLVIAVRTIAICILAIATGMYLLTRSFEKMSDALSQRSMENVIGSLSLLGVLAGLLIGIGFAFSKVKMSRKAVRFVVAFTAFMYVISSAFKTISDVVNSSDAGTVTASLGILISMVGMLMLVGTVFSSVKIKHSSFISILGFSLFMIVLSTVFKSIVKTVKGSNIGEVLGSLGILISIAGLLMLVGLVFSYIKIKKNSFKTLLLFSLFISAISMAFSSISKVVASNDLGTIAGSLGILVGMAGLLMLVGLVFSHIKVKGESIRTMIALSIFMLTLSSVFNSIVKAVKGSNIEDVLISVGILVGMAGLLMLIGVVFSRIKFKKESLKTVLSLAAFMGVLSLAFTAIMKVVTDSDPYEVLIGLGILISMAGLLMLVGLVFSYIKIKGQAIRSMLSLSIFMGVLSAVFASIVALINATDLVTVAASLGVLIAMAGLLMLVGLVFSHIKLKGEKISTVIALSLFMAALTTVLGYIVNIVTKNDLGTVFISLGILIGIAGLLMFLGLAFSKIKINSQSLGTMIVGVVAIIAIAGALALLAHFDWPGLIEAAGSLSLVLLAVSAALFIISKSNPTGAILGSAAILVVSAAMIVLSYAMQKFNDVDISSTAQAAVLVATLALSLAILGKVGPMVIVGAASLLVAAASLIVIAQALKQFTGIDWESFGQLAAVLGVLVLVTAILGALNAAAIIGAAALVIAAVGLIAIAGAMQLFAQVSDKISGEFLMTIAGSLILFGVAGIVLASGVTGLILGGAGLLIVASALMLMGKVDSSLDLARLSGLAAGLMLLGIAGTILMTGSTGLMIGGIGLAILGAGLLVFNAVHIKGKDLIALASGVLMMAAAGVIGRVAGVGLILLSAGITALAGAMWLLMKVYSSFLEVNLQKMASDANQAGQNVVEGATQGINSGLGTLGKVVSGMAFGIINTFSKILGIASPSEVFKKLGNWILSGLGLGVSDETLNSGLGDTMKDVAKNLLSNFTGELSSGFGDIESIFNKFDKKTKKWVETGGHYEYGRGWVKEGYWEEVEESMFGDFTELFGGLSDSFNTMFSEDGFDGLDSLKGIFENLDLDEVDIDVDKLAGSFGDLDGAVTNTGDSTKKTTKSFADSMSVFSEFSRKMNTTVRDVQKNLMSQVTGVKEWQTMIENLEHFGYDKEIGLYFLEKGFDTESYNYLQALTAAGGQGIEKVNELNEQFKEFIGLGKGGDKWTEKMTKHYKGLGETTRDLSKLTMTMDMVTGEIMILSDTVSDINPFSALGEEASQSSKDIIDSALSLENYITQTDKQAKYLEKKEAAMGKANQNTADAMILSFTEQVQNALGKYFLPSKFTEIGTNICAGLVAGIAMNEGFVYDEAERFAKAVVQVMKTNFKVESPSKITMQIGEYLDEGLAIGLGSNGESEKSAKSLTDVLMRELFMTMQEIGAIMDSDDEWQPTIRPIVDFTNIQASAMEAKRLFDGTQVALASSDFSNFKASITPTGTGMMSMTKDEFQQFLTGFANEVINGINAGDKNVSVNVNLEGDAKGVFKLVKDENDEYRKTSGRSAFV